MVDLLPQVLESDNQEVRCQRLTNASPNGKEARADVFVLIMQHITSAGTLLCLSERIIWTGLGIFQFRGFVYGTLLIKLGRNSGAVTFSLFLFPVVFVVVRRRSSHFSFFFISFCFPPGVACALLTSPFHQALSSFLFFTCAPRLEYRRSFLNLPLSSLSLSHHLSEMSIQRLSDTFLHNLKLSSHPSFVRFSQYHYNTDLIIQLVAFSTRPGDV